MKSNFDDGMKFVDITPVHRKDDVTNKSAALLVDYLLVQKSLKELFRTKLRSLLIHV